jgi:hypothetical protein
MDWFTLYMLIGLFNAMLGIPNFHDEPFLDAVVSALFYFWLWPLQAAFKILVWIHAGTGWLLEKVMG